jgi:CBS domain-containing protein
LSRSTIYALLTRHGARTPVVEVMTASIPVVPVDDDLAETARLLQEGNWPAIGVVDATDRLVGLITRETLDDIAALADATRKRGRKTFDAVLGRGAA